ncbi:MAG TPA: DEAD/DEAH box helicase, partial [Armatimonadetes bacterium]|nr:DEAD/DEAH box helicase [Armatimonadota bacterium]
MANLDTPLAIIFSGSENPVLALQEVRGGMDFPLKPGQRVHLLPENEIAEVYRLERQGDRYVVGLIFESTRQAITLILTPEELRERIQPLPSLRDSFERQEEVLPREQFLAFTDALRIKLAYTFDPHYAVSVTQVDLLPHQVEAVYKHILPQPRVRFLLADDPGLGKTIMAGLVLKELKARGLVKSVLIVVPAHLQDQWLREMKEWFREDFTLLNRSVLADSLTGDFFSRNPQIITSMDFARQDWVREILRRHRWDMIIVDEAHKFSATRYGNKIRKTKRYQLGEVLSQRCDHLLFLTATPHKGDDDAYFLLLDLLQPRLFSCPKDLKEAGRKGEVFFVLRRSKEQVTDLEGRPLFKRREVKTLSVRLTEAERFLYERVTAYVRKWYRVVSGKTDRRSRNVALALTILQRRLSSSLYAVRESLRRRRSKLQRLLEEWERRLDEDESLPVLDEEALEDMLEQTSADWENFQERLEGVTAARTPEELKEEIKELDELISLAVQAEKAGEEAKVNELRKVVEERLRYHPEEKLVVFTEFKDTLLALWRKFEREWGIPVAVIHGGMRLQDRIEQERYFRDQVQVLLGTDAAGEGINLQFCRLMVNFDLPWNPNKLEQRMGRIHRYGQRRECFIFNMLYPETREGRVLERLLEKLELMRQRLGDSVYDVIGHLLEGVRLEELIMEAIMGEEAEEVERRIEVDVERRLEEYRRALEENALADHHIDRSFVLANDRDSLKKRLVPWDIERFTRLVLPLLGGDCQPDQRKEGVFRIRLPRTFLRQHNLPHESFSRGVRIAFDRKRAREAGVEFFAPGHPVLDAICDQFLKKSRPVKSVLLHPKAEGVLWVFRARIQDGHQSPVLERLLALLWDAEKGETREVDLRMLWETKPYPKNMRVKVHRNKVVEITIPKKHAEERSEERR